MALDRRVLTPLVLRFMQQHPELHIKLSFEDRYVNLAEQSIDLVVRMGRLADSSLGALTLGHKPWVLVAAPAHLAAHGTPAVPADLARHAALISAACRAASAGRSRALLAAVRQGMGVAVLTWYVVHDSVQSGAEQPLLLRREQPRQDLHAVYPSPRLLPAKVSGLARWLREKLKGARWARRLSRGCKALLMRWRAR